MRSYFRLKFFLAAFLLVYPILGIASLLTPNQEVFPFYSWFLFAEVPNPSHRYDVQVVADGPQTFDPPQPYNEAIGLAILPKTITAYQFIQKIGAAYEAGDHKRVAELRKLFERNFIKASCTYQLTRTYYDPIKRWHGETSRIEVITTFSPEPAAP